METSTTRYEIIIEGHLDSSWSEWLEHLTIIAPDAAQTVLRGELPDQSALFGVLKKLHHLGRVLVSVRRLDFESEREDTWET